MRNFMKTFINIVFGKKKLENEFEIDLKDILPEREDVELFVPEERLISKFDPSKHSILIIDDSKGIISIVEDYIKVCKVDTSNYNVLTFFGVYAPFVMERTLDVLKQKGLNKIEFAIIDIVLPGKIKIEDKNIKKDGIDVAISLNTHFSCNNFCFYTGNILQAYEEFAKEKEQKFKKKFHKDLKDFIIFKGDGSDENVIKEFCKLLAKEKYKND